MMTLSILQAYIRRDWAIKKSYRFGLIGQLISSGVSLCVFFFIGKFVDRSGIIDEANLRYGYFSFVIVGITIWNILIFVVYAFQNALVEVQSTGALEAILATPPSSTTLIICGPVYNFVTAISEQLIVLVLATFLLGIRFHFSALSLVCALLAVLSCIGLFSALGLMLAGVTLVVKRGATRPIGFLMSGMVLLGGIYYPVTVLPAPLQVLARCIPLTWGIEVSRSALLTDQVLVGKLLMLVLTTLIAIPIALWSFNMGLDRARREGSLTQY